MKTAQRKPMKPQAAVLRLEDLCARSEQCTADLLRKLSTWGLSKSDSEKIIKHLTETRFLDDSRYARAYVRDKYRFSGWGRKKIISGLYTKHISKSLIEEAITEINLKEYATIAFRAIASKLRQLPPDMSHSEKRQRLMRFAAGRGYEVALIIKIIDSQRLWQSSET